MELSHLEPEAREFLRGERFCGAVESYLRELLELRICKSELRELCKE